MADGASAPAQNSMADEGDAFSLALSDTPQGSFTFPLPPQAPGGSGPCSPHLGGVSTEAALRCGLCAHEPAMDDMALSTDGGGAAPEESSTSSSPGSPHTPCPEHHPGSPSQSSNGDCGTDVFGPLTPDHLSACAKALAPIHVAALSYSIRTHMAWAPPQLARYIPASCIPQPPLQSNSEANLSARHPGLESAPGGGSSASSKKVLLNSISFDAEPGQILAIAGSSGAGKSTLLDALAGRIQPSSLRGTALVQGLPVGHPGLRRVMGYVTQDDALFPVLTPRETLLLSARLRLSSSIPAKAKAERVATLLEELGLQAVADSRIGSVEKRGISGGERRRVSIGTDLVHDPPVLLLDEPTSGLDSHAALKVVEVLRRMADDRRRTILLTIHQPSIRILEMVDRVVLLSHGALAHCGTMAQLEGRLDSAGFPVPLRMNGLEYCIELLKTCPDEMKNFVAGPALSSGTVSDSDIESNHSGSTSSSLSSSSPPSPPQSDRLASAPFTGAQVKHSGRFFSWAQTDSVHEERKRNSLFHEVAALSGRNLKVMLRTKELCLVRGAQVAFCGLCLGTLFLRVPTSFQGIQERMGYLAFSLAFLLTSSVEALPIFLQERQVFLRETSSGAYRVISYMLASVLVFLPFLLGLAAIFSVTSYWLVGLTPTASAFFFFVLTMWIVLLTANSVVACLAALAPDFITANSMIAGLMGAFFLFSGYFISKNNIPNYWMWVYYLSIFKYPLEALLVNEYQGDNADVLFTFQTGSQVLDSLGLSATNKWREIGVLFAYAVVYRVICYAALSWQRTMRH